MTGRQKWESPSDSELFNIEGRRDKERRIEILAPAGSQESLRAAVCAGADAVYIGGTRFGARAYAKNLNEDEMLEAIDYVHIHGRRIYLTVNTLLKDSEIQGLYGYRGVGISSQISAGTPCPCKYPDDDYRGGRDGVSEETGSRARGAGKGTVP